MRFDNAYYENYKKYMKTINQYNNILNVNYNNPGNEIEKSQNLKFNYNVHAFEFKSDSLAEKNLGCTTTNK
ncbi:hypothetical protein H8356DRAFT_1275752 [Neocallimastix lanati (nom. inval.)]|nr:hypothetical protein H8356DRAFT_1275752 [Neocallimastix sp. JGI-2020a]